MPRYRVTGPDGKTYTVNAPEGATPEQALEYVRSQNAPERAPLLSGETAAGVLRSVNQGSIPFIGPLSEEIASGVNTAIGYNPSTGGYFDYGPGASYGENLKAERGALEKFRSERPNLAMGSEVLGGAPAAVATAGVAVAPKATGELVKRLLPAGERAAAGASVPAAAGLTARTARGAGAGGAYGYGYGFGAGEGGIPERMASAEGPAVGGTILGGATPPLGAIASKGYSTFADNLGAYLGNSNTKVSQAARKVGEAIIRDFPDMPPEQVALEAKRIVQKMGPKAVLADTGENIRKMTGALSRLPGKQQTRINKFVEARQEGVRDPETGVLQGGQAGRVGQVLDDISADRLKGTQDTLRAQRSAEGREAFEEALDTGPIHSDRLKQFVDEPNYRAGFKRGLELERLDALENGRPFDPYKYGVTGFNEAGDPILGKVPTMRTYQAMKEGMDAQIADEMDEFGRLSKRGVALQKVQQKYLDELDAYNPAYAEARQKWAGPSALLDASNDGFRFMSKAEFKNADELSARLAKMSPDERHHFRIGAVQALRDKMGDTVRRGDVTKQLIGKPELERKIRLAFGNDRVFKRYVDAMENEGEMFKLYSEVKGNSATAQRLAAQKDLSVDPGARAQTAVDLVADPVNPLNWLRSGSRYVGDLARRLGVPEPVREEMADILLSQDIGPLLRGLETAQMSEAQRRALGQGILAAELAATGPRSQ